MIECLQKAKDKFDLTLGNTNEIFTGHTTNLLDKNGLNYLFEKLIEKVKELKGEE